MENKKVYLTLIMAVLISSGINYAPEVWDILFEKTIYVCSSKPDLGPMYCDGFSKWISPVGKCLNATWEGINYGNKICKTGWEELVDDRTIQDQEYNLTFTGELPVIIVIEKPREYKSLESVVESGMILKEIYPNAKEIRCNSDMEKCCVMEDGVMNPNECNKIKVVTLMEKNLGVK